MMGFSRNTLIWKETTSCQLSVGRVAIRGNRNTALLSMKILTDLNLLHHWCVFLLSG